MSGDTGETESHSEALYFPIIAIFVGLLLDEVNKKFSFVGLPDSVFQFLFALVSSALVCVCLPVDMVEWVNVRTWAKLEPNTVLTILLPPLIFESSFKINAHSFFAKKWYIIALTSFVYTWTLILSTAILLSSMKIFHSCDWQAVALFVSIIVATDPVAVVAMLEQYGAPHRLRLLIEGESLLNDGLALTAYRILQQLMVAHVNNTAIEYMDLVTAGLMCILVSPPLGMLLAWITAWFVKKLSNSKAQQGFIIVAVYGTFIFFNAIEGSAALGLVCFGVTLSLLKEGIGPDTCEGVLQLWQALAYCCNNIIFIFSGYVVGREIFSTEGNGFYEVNRSDIFTLIEGSLYYFIPLFARIVSVYFFYHLYYIFTGKWQSRSDFVILAYAGLRGALGLILALELNKVKELKGKDNVDQTKVILLLTCSTTVLCLFVQGCSFPAMAMLEGTTKRSRYTRETNQKLSKSLRFSLDNSLSQMKKQHPAYLHGANWTAVADIIKKILKVHEKAMDLEVQNSDDLDEDDLWDGVYEDEEDDETRDARQKKRDETDAKMGLFGILLAKVHESWRIGMTSGETSHVIVSLLEHGIDEGTIEVKDMHDHLRRVDSNWAVRRMARISSSLHGWMRRNRWIDYTDGLAGNPMFHESEKPDMLMDRTFEKWFLFHSIVILAYCVLYGLGTFSHLNSFQSLRYTAHLLYFLFFFSTFMEFLLIVFVSRNRAKEAAKYKVVEDEENSFWPRLCSKEGTISFFNLLVVITGTGMNACLQFYDDRACDHNTNVHCDVLKYAAFGCAAASLLYRMSRTLPLMVILVREYIFLKEQKTERVRLSILFYLVYLVKDTVLPKELFTETTYRIVKRESRNFTKLIDAVLRNELKLHTAELDMISVIKSRQSVRMMSHVLKEKLEDMRRRGFVPEDVEHRWDGIVGEIRNAADKMLTVPELDTEAWLDRLTWAHGLNDKDSRNLKNLLIRALSVSEAKKYERGEKIHLHGIAFVKKGVCKVTEGICSDDAHEFYVNQGEIMGPRNLLVWRMKQKEPHSQYWSPYLPHRKYIATTYVELHIMGEEVLRQILAIPDTYTTTARYVQKKRIVAEVKRLHPSTDLTVENFDTFVKQKKVQVIAEETLVTVTERHLAIVGCWTRLAGFRSTHPMDAVNRHVYGPAKMILAPADNQCEGYVFILPDRAERSSNGLLSKTKTTITGSAEFSTFERSNYSLMVTPKGNNMIKKTTRSH